MRKLMQALPEKQAGSSPIKNNYSQMKNHSEAELINLLKAGDIPAFDEFYKRNWKPLYNLAYRSVCCQDEAMDLVQNVFVILWDNRKNLNPDKCIEAFLFTILKNNIINFYRKEAVKRRKMEVIASPTTNTPTNEEVFFAKELSQRINGEIDLLPQKMQQVFILSRREHKSVLEISQELNIAPRTVKNQLSNALKTLRTRLDIKVSN